jgi:flavodoxin
MSNEAKDADKIDLTRRDLLKGTFVWLLAGVLAPLLPYPSSTHAAGTGIGGRKILITYFSRTGNTREIANQIHEIVGGEIIELQTVKPYPEDYEAIKKQAMQELDSGFKPELKTKVKEIRSYDVIFVGTPIWWSTMSTPVKSFLSQYDLSGKTIVPFVTHGGSGLGRSISDIQALCPHSTILDGLAVWGKEAKTARNDVSAWVHRLRVKE